MKIIRDVSKIEKSVLEKGTVVTLGAFDGMHIGHIELIRETERVACDNKIVPVMLTFPLKGKCLMASEEKYSYLERTSGIELVVEQPFVPEFSNLSPSEFAEKYLKGMLNCKCIVIGFNNRFGKNAAGDVGTMKMFGEQFGFKVIVVPPVCLRGGEDAISSIVVSSTQIKEYLKTGNVESGSAMLGRDYVIKGDVKEGKKLGRTIGFPTANVYPGNDVFLPKNGVYAAKVRLEDGREKNAMINVGVNPTVKEQEKILEREKGIILPDYKVEANLFDFDEDIYGQEIEIILKKFMREEQRFVDVAELTSVLANDRKQIAEYFSGGSK